MFIWLKKSTARFWMSILSLSSLKGERNAVAYCWQPPIRWCPRPLVAWLPGAGCRCLEWPRRASWGHAWRRWCRCSCGAWRFCSICCHWKWRSGLLGLFRRGFRLYKGRFLTKGSSFLLELLSYCLWVFAQGVSSSSSEAATWKSKKENSRFDRFN